MASETVSKAVKMLRRELLSYLGEIAAHNASPQRLSGPQPTPFQKHQCSPVISQRMEEVRVVALPISFGVVSNFFCT